MEARRDGAVNLSGDLGLALGGHHLQGTFAARTHTFTQTHAPLSLQSIRAST